MSQILKFIEMAKKSNCHELVLRAGFEVQMRSSDILIPISGVQADPRWLMEILEEEEKEALMENLTLVAVKFVEDLRVKLALHLDMDGLGGVIRWQNEKAQWSLPELYLDRIQKSQGLHFVCGPEKSGRTQALNEIISSHLGNANSFIAVVSDFDEYSFEDQIEVLRFHTQDLIERKQLPAMVDTVVFDSQEPEVMSWALDLSEKGKNVILMMTSTQLASALDLFADKVKQDRMLVYRRLSLVTQSLLGLKLVPGLNSSLEAVFEVCLVPSELRSQLQLGNFGRLVEVMKEGAEKTGSRSLNQSLMGLVLKRKIDLKSAFRASYEPQELDGMLKKIGI